MRIRFGVLLVALAGALLPVWRTPSPVVDHPPADAHPGKARLVADGTQTVRVRIR